MLHAYPGLDDRKILAMRVDRFWFLSRNIDRLHAEADIRMLRLLGMSQSPEGTRDMIQELQTQLGKIAVYDEGVRARTSSLNELDVDGLNSLRGMRMG